MPQLNPNPWFLTLLMSWATFSLIIQPKLLAFTTTNPPSTKSKVSPKTTPWAWPWT
uniref:ATP synthase complex subunit 8 n=2 Tax=Ardea cinerea TaxID=30390 RepID=B7ZJT5_ARDCI|nr:ATP synthase F0 subunit 8 [Ardea cinerea]AAT72186.1 ATP synthase F0 subunit 8 [Ardea cinerea]AHN95755.1 ATP synthase F0 subunit 8 [Ardea cinerea]QHI42518.1 ATP synthase F0 subunit 8 [Ardea cinerea]BAE44348.1 F0-ATP synthase subunit 8 [Ardea cinerea jouyi]